MWLPAWLPTTASSATFVRQRAVWALEEDVMSEYILYPISRDPAWIPSALAPKLPPAGVHDR